MHTGGERLTLRVRVSIRTRSFDRVMRMVTARSALALMFQSAPGLSTG